MKIGIAGTGRMGAAIAGRVLRLGHAVAVWNRTPEKTTALAAAGAIIVVHVRSHATHTSPTH